MIDDELLGVVPRPVSKEDNKAMLRPFSMAKPIRQSSLFLSIALRVSMVSWRGFSLTLGSW